MSRLTREGLERVFEGRQGVGLRLPDVEYIMVNEASHRLHSSKQVCSSNGFPPALSKVLPDNAESVLTV